MLVSRPTMGAVLAVLMGLGLSSTSEATPQTYNFEGLAAGTVVSGQLPSGEILSEDVYAPFNISVEAVNAANSLAIFDTAHPTGNDFDLGTPNQDFGGPGIGDGGRMGMPGENRTAQGKVLIIPQNLIDINNDGLIDQPNDNASGGAITVQFPTKGLLHSMQFIDIEEPGFSIDLYDDDQLVQSFPIRALGDNSQVKVNTQTTRLVDRVVVTMTSSGALSVMIWEPLGCLPPECNISGDAVACVNNLRTFTTTIGPEFTRLWSTSGPCSIEGPANGTSVDVRFNGAGPCTVSLTVSDPVDPQACTTVCSHIVNVTPLPPCGISGPEQVCIGGTRAYSTSAGAAYTKAWSTTSTPAGICAINGAADGSSVNIDFTGAGVCTLSLIVSDPADPENCRSECMLLVSSAGLPPCNISGDFSVCVGNTKTYTTTVDESYNRQWSVSSTPAGICSTIGALDGGSVQVQFSGAGVCTLSLNVADPNDPELCMTTCTQIVTVNPQPNCDIAGDRTACIGNQKTYSTTVTGYTLKWSAVSTPGGICAINGSDDGSSVAVDFSGGGVCTLSLTVTDPNDPADCVTVCSFPITVGPQPNCSFTGPLNVCIDNTRTYNAAAGAGHSYDWSATSTPAGICSIPGSTTGSSVDVSFTGAGTCTLSLTVRDANDPEFCASTCTQIITVANQPPCTITGDPTRCVGTSGTYSVSAAGFSTSWSATSTPAGICAINGPTDGASVDVSFTGAGECTLSVTVFDPNDPQNCTSTCSLIVTVTPKPPCNVSGALTACVGATSVYSTTVDSGYDREWSVTSTPSGICETDGPTTGGSVSVKFTGAGTCTVSLTVSDPNDPENCASICSQTVTVNDLPPCDITGDVLRCIGTSGTYSTSAGAAYTRSWSASSTPAGICAIDGPTNGSSVNVNFTGAGECTLSLTVSDPNDPESCRSTCSTIITVASKPPCDISGAATACVGATGSYSTTVGSEYARQWSASSTPAGICSIDGSTTGGSVSVSFTGAGTCTLSLSISDPNNPEDCSTICEKIITVNNIPACDITGSQERCIGDSGTYSTSVDAGLTKIWSVSSTPAGICAVNGPTNGSSVSVDFTGAGRCTVSLTVIDPVDPENCRSSCTLLVDVIDCTPEPESCWMTGGGCLRGYEPRGYKNHTFGGNVGPQPSGSWEHVVRQGNTIEFNFHSWDARSDSCWKDSDPGPCSPAAENNNINYSGTGLYSDGNGRRDEPATFRAHVEDRGESGHGPGACGGKDYYEIWVYDLSGNIVFHAAGELDCGNLQIHKNVPANKDKDDNGPSPSGSLADAAPIVMAPASPNPFRAETRIAYSVRSDSGRNVTVSVFDVSGRQIRRLVDGYEGSGDHETTWDGRTDQGDMVTGGMYFVRVSTGASQAITRVMFVR